MVCLLALAWRAGGTRWRWRRCGGFPVELGDRGLVDQSGDGARRGGGGGQVQPDPLACNRIQRSEGGARRRGGASTLDIAGRAAWATAVEGARERRWRWEASWRPPRQVGGQCDMAVVVGRRPMRTVGTGVAHHHAGATRSGGRRPASRRKGDNGRPTGAARYGGTVGHVVR